MSRMQKSTMHISHHNAKYRLLEPSIANTVVNSNLPSEKYRIKKVNSTFHSSILFVTPKFKTTQMVGASSHYHSQFFHLRRLYALRKLLNEGPLFTNKTDKVLRSDTRTISSLSYSLKVLCNSTKWEAKVVSCTCLHE